jgi:glutaredoxin
MKRICFVLAFLLSGAYQADARCNAYDEVYVFERPGCMPCHNAKAFLRMNGEAYETRDARYPANRKYMSENAGTIGTPVITIGNRRDGYRHVAGFNVSLLQAYLCLR